MAANTDFQLQRSGVHPVLGLINKCDGLAKTFDNTFARSVALLEGLTNGTSTTSLDETMQVLRETLDRCEQIVGEMLNCIYADIPLLLDQMDANQPGLPGNFNPKSALDSISQLFYSYQELLLEKRELLADFTCEEITPQDFVQRWTSIEDGGLHNERKKDIDDLADLLSAF
ncbi:hypothetical protein BCV70DRAFT_57163 [Testicularia cyperi]|uniref:Uncharacterized protein n=1 Tax=Testicularia cyperi TaxID=1882483 RepID=A0A317XW24_9BASI|nr:hypothetical protein BCV70DRAFT_57163 [Testicularia cyperi]